MCMEKIKKLLPYLVIAGFAIVALIPLLFCDYYVGHDICYHLEAISSLNVSWNETHSIARIYDIICQDYGYGTGLFYSMIPALICVTLINVFHLSALNALVIEIFIVRYLSGVVMYFLIKRIFGNSPIATFVAVCYIIFPYFFTNLNVRFAFSEIFIMLTLPIVALGVWELFNNNQRAFIPLFTLGCSLTLLIHFTLGVYLAIILAILFVINYKQIFSWTKIISICISFGLILMIALGFIIPMLVNYGEINLRSMARSGESLFNSVLSIFHEDYLVPSTIFALVAYVLFFIVYLKKRDKAKIEKRFFIFVNIIYVFASPICPWYWLGFIPFSMIQFVCRLFNFVAIIVAIMIGYVLINVKKRWLVNLIKLGLLSYVAIVFYICILPLWRCKKK